MVNLLSFRELDVLSSIAAFPPTNTVQCSTGQFGTVNPDLDHVSAVGGVAYTHQPHKSCDIINMQRPYSG